MEDDGVAETIDALGPVHIRELIARTRDAFALHRDEIDALNVFPVPDGDTGTNLYLTARSAVEEAGHEPDPTSLARGALLGARGNSGVIFSQVLRAFAETVEEKGHLDPGGLALALERAKRHAYEAVANPVEGTMLTTIRAAADAAADRAATSLADVLRDVCTAVSEAVARTPEQLDVLRDAGVVDAGGRGFEVFCQALHSLVTGEPPPEPQVPPPVVHRTAPVAPRESGSLEYRFEVQYLLTADDRAAAPLRQRLGRIGDSVVVVSAGDILNVHVHTNDIGAAIEEGLDFGRPSRIQVTSFADQIEDPDHTMEQADQPVGDAALGCVAVLPGPGLRELAESVGAVAIQAGGGDLPAVADLLRAVGSVGAGSVVFLPGHANVVPSAQQAAVLAAEEGRVVEVVGAAITPTRVLAALAVWDRSAALEDVVGAMGEAASAGASGEVVAAVRDGQTPLGDVREGQYLALRDGEVIAIDDDPLDALRALAQACDVAEADVLTLVTGADVDADERDRAVALLEDLSGGDLEVLDGRQRPARYLLGAEA